MHPQQHVNKQSKCTEDGQRYGSDNTTPVSSECRKTSSWFQRPKKTFLLPFHTIYALERVFMTRHLISDKFVVKYRNIVCDSDDIVSRPMARGQVPVQLSVIRQTEHSFDSGRHRCSLWSLASSMSASQGTCIDNRSTIYMPWVSSSHHVIRESYHLFPCKQTTHRHLLLCATTLGAWVGSGAPDRSKGNLWSIGQTFCFDPTRRPTVFELCPGACTIFLLRRTYMRDYNETYTWIPQGIWNNFVCLICFRMPACQLCMFVHLRAFVHSHSEACLLQYVGLENKWAHFDKHM